MSVKYHCPKCERRFVDWGAEKLKYKCPDCESEELVLVTHGESTTTSAKPSLKRRTKKPILEESPVFANTFENDSDASQFEGFSPAPGSDSDSEFEDDDTEAADEEIEGVEAGETEFDAEAETVDADATTDDEEESESATEEEEEN